MTARKTIVASVMTVIALCLLVVFQNCQANHFSSMLGDSRHLSTASQSDGNGYSYDGKVYRHKKSSGLCSDGSADEASIVLNASGQYFLLRDACAAVLPPRLVSVARLSDPPGPDQILFEGRVFTADENPLATPTPNPTPYQFKGLWSQAATVAGSPNARAGHSAVWTGTTMIVWGGDDPNAPARFKADGAAFDPKTNTWSALNAGGVPLSHRSQHSAVWSGSEVIVWGGFNGTFLGNGAKYNPQSGASSSIASSHLSARGGHSAVWTGTEMIVWGGSISAFVGARDGAIYNPATNQWRYMSSVGAPSARTGHAVLWTGKKMIVWGGANPAGPVFLNDGGVYDPATDTWSPLAQTSAPIARDYPTAVQVDSKLVIMGGFSGAYLNDVAVFDPATGVWTAEAPLTKPEARYAHSAIWTGAEMIVFGGLVGNVGPVHTLAPTDLWSYK